jgi:hypothetical protein
VTKNILGGQKDGQTDRGKTVYPPPPSGSGGINTNMALMRICYTLNSAVGNECLEIIPQINYYIIKLKVYF